MIVPLKDIKLPFNPGEQAAMAAIVTAHNEFCKLERQHPDEMREWVDAIHALQNILGWRILRRDYPDQFPIKK